MERSLSMSSAGSRDSSPNDSPPPTPPTMPPPEGYYQDENTGKSPFPEDGSTYPPYPSRIRWISDSEMVIENDYSELDYDELKPKQK